MRKHCFILWGLFHDITGKETVAGQAAYMCATLENPHSTKNLQYEKIYIAATVKAIRYMYIISLQLLMTICDLKSIPSKDYPSVLFGCRDLYLTVGENLKVFQQCP